MAQRILDFVEKYDPYSITEDAAQEVAEALAEDAEGIINWLASFLDEEDSIATEAAALIADITERRAA